MNLKGENVEDSSNYTVLLICFVLASNRDSVSAGTKYQYGFQKFFFFFFFYCSDTKGKDSMMFLRESNSKLVTMECLLAVK